MSGLGDRGKWAEKQVQLWLDKTAAARWDFAYHRFPDARAARGAMAAQPSDFLVAHRNGYLLEVKETQNSRRLPKDKLSQYGKLKMFNVAGFHVLVVVYLSSVRTWTYLSDEDLFCLDDCPPSFPFEESREFASATDVLDHFFGF